MNFAVVIYYRDTDIVYDAFLVQSKQLAIGINNHFNNFKFHELKSTITTLNCISDLSELITNHEFRLQELIEGIKDVDSWTATEYASNMSIPRLTALLAFAAKTKPVKHSNSLTMDIFVTYGLVISREKSLELSQRGEDIILSITDDMLESTRPRPEKLPPNKKKIEKKQSDSLKKKVLASQKSLKNNPLFSNRPKMLSPTIRARQSLKG